MAERATRAFDEPPVGQNPPAMPRRNAPAADAPVAERHAAATPAAPAPATLGDRLAAARRARFIGRSAECDRFRRMLAGQAEPVWFLHGPGGIGKTTLLRELAREADAQRRIVIEIDARHVGATPAGWRQALTTALSGLGRSEEHGDAPDADSHDQIARATETLPAHPPAGSVLLVDTFEAIAAIELWLRDEELPRFHADTLVVLAGRTPADPQWRLDAGWSDVAVVTTLAPWSAAEAHDYLATRLQGRPVPEALLAQGRGYPLLLALLADAQRRGAPQTLQAAPEREALVRELLARFAHELSDPALRTAFDVLTIARHVAVPLLADVVGPAGAQGASGAERAAELYHWLQGLPFVETGEHGLQMHDFVRESFAASWESRDPVEIERLRVRVMQHQVRGWTTVSAADVDRHVRDWYFSLHHTRSSPFLDARYFDSHYLDTLDAARDPPQIEALVERRLGPRTLAAVRHWLAHAPSGFRLVRRRDGGVDGVLLTLELAEIDTRTRDDDPVAARAWRYVQAQRAPRPGGSVWMARLVLDAHGDQLPNATSMLGSTLLVRRLQLQRHAEWSVMWHHNPEEMAALYATMTRFNWLHRVGELDEVIDGRRHGCFVRDLVAEPVPEAWRAAPPGAPPLLTQDAFAAAVRDALRHYARDDKLATNPLRRCRSLAGRNTPDGNTYGASEAPLARLREALAQAVQALAAHPADLKFHHALRLTWLDPGSTQERVAEELGLPFNTYRYHLARGTERVVQALWQRELQATAADTPVTAEAARR